MSSDFKERHYEYRDKRYTSATTALSPWPKPWLAAYGAKHAAERAVFQFAELQRRLNSDDPLPWTLKWLKSASEERKEAAGDHGTGLHAYLEARMSGEARPAVITPDQQEVENFLDLYKPDPLYIEMGVVSFGDGWAGTFDLIAKVYGETLVIDLKTSPLDMRDHKSRLQVAAYRHGDIVGNVTREYDASGREVRSLIHAPEFPAPATDGAALLLIPRGDPRGGGFWRVKAGIEEYRLFLSCLRIKQFYEETRGTGVGELIFPQAEVA